MRKVSVGLMACLLSLLVFFSLACGKDSGYSSDPPEQDVSSGQEKQDTPANESEAPQLTDVDVPYVVQKTAMIGALSELKEGLTELIGQIHPSEYPFGQPGWETRVKELLQDCDALVLEATRIKEPAGAQSGNYRNLILGVETVGEGCGTIEFANQEQDGDTFWTGYQLVLKGVSIAKRS